MPNDQHQFKLREGLSLSALPLHDLGALCERRIQSAIASTSDPQRASQVLATIVLGGEDPPAAVIRYISESGLDELLGTGLIQQRSGSLYFAQGALRARAEEVTRKMPDLQRLHNALVQASVAWVKNGGRRATGLGVHRLGAEIPRRPVPLQNATKTLLTQGHSSAIQTAALAVRAARAIEPKDNKLPFVAGLESLRLQAAAYVESEDYEPAIQL